MRPETEAELAEIVRGANGPLVVRGGGTRGIGVVAGEVVETGGLSGIVLYEPGALTLVARAGSTLAEIEATLGAEGQRLAFEPPDMRAVLGTAGQSTLGGVVAANASGPRRMQAGAARDFALGVRFVDGRGNVIKNGGRVMKNVTGLDLVKLMAGSRGTLGILTEISLKVLPVPETEVTLVARGLDVAAAVAAMARGLGSPFEVTGAAHLAASGETRLRIEGLAGSVAYRQGRLLAMLGGDWAVAEGAASAALWREVRDVGPLVGLPGNLWRVHLKPSDAGHLLEAMPGVPALVDWGGGLVWLRLAEGQGARLRAVVATLGGHATRWSGDDDVPAEAPEAAGVTVLSAGLRAEFDPRGVFGAGAAR